MTLLIFVFIFGAIIGSFVNVLIYRLPREENIVWPRSHCTSCKTQISWYQNIPVLSYLFLKGKCAKCKESISWRYPIIELLCGVLSILLFPHHLTLESLAYFFLYYSIACVFVAHIMIDLEFQILPDGLNIYLALICLTYSILHHSWMFWVIGGAVGFLFPFIVTWVFYKLRGKIGMGGGDIKLFAALGIILGPQGIIHNIFISCFLGALIGIILIVSRRMNKDKPIPFGPFIIIAASIQIYFPSIVQAVFG